MRPFSFMEETMSKYAWAKKFLCVGLALSCCLWADLTQASPTEAESASTGGGAGGSGIDNYNVPSTRSFNFTLKATF